MMAQQPIWPGSGSAASGSTPFGLYDTDTEFQSEAPKLAVWCAKRLGYPIMDVELQDNQFYACDALRKFWLKIHFQEILRLSRLNTLLNLCHMSTLFLKKIQIKKFSRISYRF